ncbi:hypothetical protein CONLIGDRAFT_286894 [Coniochaeta ligniaria NRRL 30616]|uniref:Secreted protein n=1 Tax=Coniochaeta ligniaria NRRL 30616 TaxID=1408157 RepID=A0A1J7IU02_9PEZI|nr:hypothetical protein CONLIGDRAFT_286894 [Coniochaeta ligniaria NRRL 30616]
MQQESSRSGITTRLVLLLKVYLLIPPLTGSPTTISPVTSCSSRTLAAAAASAMLLSLENHSPKPTCSLHRATRTPSAHVHRVNVPRL